MQEKQRLAHQQEQVQGFKQQSALTPTNKPTNNQSVNSMHSQSTTTKQTTIQGTKDLTSTLVNSQSFMSGNMNKPLNQSMTMSQSTYPPMGIKTPNPFIGRDGAITNQSTRYNSMHTGVLCPTNQQNATPVSSSKNMDLSAFDNLLPSSTTQSKQSLNSMTRQNTHMNSSNQNSMMQLNMGMGMPQQRMHMSTMSQQNNTKSSEFDTLFG